MEGWYYNDYDSSEDEWDDRGGYYIDEDDDALFERPSFRLGKLRGGKVGSRRRQGEHRCMGWCGMCNWEAGRDSMAHYRARQYKDFHKVVCDVHPGGGREFMSSTGRVYIGK